MTVFEERVLAKVQARRGEPASIQIPIKTMWVGRALPSAEPAVAGAFIWPAIIRPRAFAHRACRASNHPLRGARAAVASRRLSLLALRRPDTRIRTRCCVPCWISPGGGVPRLVVPERPVRSRVHGAPAAASSTAHADSRGPWPCRKPKTPAKPWPR